MKGVRIKFDTRIPDGKEEWLTPPSILAALGPFDLDPCAPISRPWPTAAKHFTVEDDGFNKPWTGRVFLNPPYGNETMNWMRRMRKHNNGIALIFARTETKMFFECVWNHASALLWIQGRLHFHHASGKEARFNSGAPSVLIAYGEQNAAALRNSGIPGRITSS